MQAHLIAPTFILAIAVYTDLRARSIYNKFILASLLLALVNSFVFFGWPGIQSGLLGMGLAFVLTFPLFMAKILGGGDVKLLAVLGLFTSYSTVLNVVVLSFIWASLIGVIYAVVSGSAKKMVTNTVGILKGLPREAIDAHKLPYAVAILMAWLSHLVILQTGGHLW
jgi:Flp pilus assembly protein protease CpaA